MSPPSKRLDPDELAYLEEERDFLLRSIEDLERERSAGDLDDEGFAALEADYTKRAADVIRAIDAGKVRFAEAAQPRSGRRTLLVGAGVLATAVMAGVILAQAVGFRSADDVGTGDIRTSVLSLLADADALIAEGRTTDAIAVYDQVLEAQPSNAEALTYKGWLTNLEGDPEEALALLDEAVLADPELPDARAFRLILLLRADRLDEASIELGAFDALSPPAAMQQLVQGSGVRTDVLMHRVSALVSAGGEISIEAVDASPAELAVASRALLVAGDPIGAVQGFVAVLGEDPDNVVALTYRGRLVAEAGESDRGLALIDEALELDPTYPDAWLWRAAILLLDGRTDEARRALAEAGPLDELPLDLQNAAADLAARLEGAEG